MATVVFPLRTVTIIEDGLTPDARERAMVVRCQTHFAQRDKKCGRRVINRWDAAEIRDIVFRIRELGHYQSDLAKEYGCSRPTISRLLLKFDARLLPGS